MKTVVSLLSCLYLQKSLFVTFYLRRDESNPGPENTKYGDNLSDQYAGGGNHLPKCWSMLCGQGISEKKPQGMHFVTPPLVRAISSFNLPIPRWPYATPTDSPFKGKRKTPSRNARMAFSRKKILLSFPDNYGNRTCAILLGAIVSVRYSTRKKMFAK